MIELFLFLFIFVLWVFGGLRQGFIAVVVADDLIFHVGMWGGNTR